MRCAWGNELIPWSEQRGNIWHGTFPRTNTLADGA